MEIEEFIEACKWGSLEEVRDKLYSRKVFFLFKSWSRSLFINTAHNGESAITNAAKHGNTEVVRFLLEHKAFVNTKDDSQAMALNYAATFDNVELVNLLLDHGAKIDNQRMGGATALLEASLLGRNETVRVLLERGATPDLADQFGNTPMSAALQNNHLEIVALLMADKLGTEVPKELENFVASHKALADLNTESKQFELNAIPQFCFIGAPFNGEAPDDISGWVEANRDLMIASLLGVEHEDEFSKLQQRIEEAGPQTILIPDISAQEITGPKLDEGSMIERSLRVLTQRLSKEPQDFEYLASAYESDAFGRCSPVGFCFVFPKLHDKEDVIVGS